MQILLFNYFLSVILATYILISTTIRDVKLYTILQESESGDVKCKVYELKEGPIIENANSAKTYDLVKNLSGFELMFIDILDNSQDSYNKLWMRAELTNEIEQFGNYSYKNWVGYIKLDDMSLKTDSSFIKIPDNENFPVFRYTISNITNSRGSALYTAGGVLYFNNTDKYSIGNSFFKYDLIKREWIDMTYLANKKLKPLVGHKSMVINNRYLVLLGGYREKNKDEIERLNRDGTYTNYIDANEYNSLYNLTVFDTVTNSWENVDIKPNIFDTSVATFDFYEFSAIVYNDKIIVLGGYAAEKASNSEYKNPYLGILDYNSKTWAWIQMDSINGEKYFHDLKGYNLLLYDNQLIISSESLPVQVFDMLSLAMKSTLRLSNISSIKVSHKAMPTYAVVLIAVSCTILLAFMYLICRTYMKNINSNRNKNNQDGPICEIWSNPDMYNINNIIASDKKKIIRIKNTDLGDSYFNQLNPKSGNQNTLNIIEFNSY